MGPPPDTKRSRKGLLLVLLLVAAVGTGGAYAVTQGSDDDPEEATSPEDTDGSTDPTAEAGSAEDLNVIDDGGAPYVDPIFGSQFGWAIEINNTGGQVATLVHVVIEFEDADGTVVETVEDYVTSLAPGDEIGIGGSVSRDDVDSFEVTAIEPGGWESPEGRGKVVTSNIEHGVGDLDRVKISFDADSTYDIPIRQPKVRVVFRNAAGELIGGVTDFSGGFMEPEGHFRDNVEIDQSFSGVDPDKTEVYLEPSE